MARKTLGIETVEKEENQHTYQWVYQVLRNNIIKLRLQPAQAISENEVSDVLGVSRTPVREAFIRLAEDGLVKITPQKRSLVSLIDLEQADEARFVRRAVEKAVIREACRCSADADRSALLANLERQRQCSRSKSVDGMLVADNDFHRVIFGMCGRERSWSYLKKLDYNYDRLRIMVIPHVFDRVIAEHQEILDVVERKEVDRIDQIVDHHLTWDAINRVVHDYPPHYFKQDIQGNQGSESRSVG